MANIHGFGNREEDERGRRLYQAGAARENIIGRHGLQNIPFLSVEISADELRRKTFLPTMKYLFCPHLKLISVTAIVSMINVFFYVLILLYSSIDKGLESEATAFLGAHPATLEMFGAKVIFLFHLSILIR